MRKTRLTLSIIALTFFACACSNKSNSNLDTPEVDPLLNQDSKAMNSYVSIFEIPATDISRAIKFYEAILSIEIEKIDIPGMQMGLLPYENQVVTAVIIQGEGYEPSTKGITIYLNAGDDLQVILDKVNQNGGEIILSKTPHADESGFFALFIDSEGNRMGLNSPN